MLIYLPASYGHDLWSRRIFGSSLYSLVILISSLYFSANLFINLVHKQQILLGSIFMEV